MPHLSLATPVGDLSLFQEEEALVAIEWGRAPDIACTPLLELAKTQLEAYFDGTLTSFDLPLLPQGTLFQEEVWRHLQLIPYGAVCTYGDIALKLGTSARAVGAACGHNPLPIVIPCHRVVGRDRSLVGYSGSGRLETKSILLSLENAPGFSPFALHTNH